MIKCGICQTSIKRTANFCENCGSNQSVVDDMRFSYKENHRGQKIIFAGLLVLCASTVYYFVIGLFMKLTGKWEFYSDIEPFSLFIAFGVSTIALLIALGLKSGNRKILAIIFASIYTIINLYWLIERIFPQDVSDSFEYLQF